MFLFIKMHTLKYTLAYDVKYFWLWVVLKKKLESHKYRKQWRIDVKGHQK